MRDSAFNVADVDEPIVDRWQCSIWDELSVLRDTVGELEAELAGVKEDRAAWEAEARSNRAKVDEQVFDVMRAVREWFDDVVLFGRRRDATQLRRRIDDVVTRAI